MREQQFINNIRTSPNRFIHKGEGHIPSNGYLIYDVGSGSTYMRGRLLGKGGFARCYELTDIKTNKIYAGKIIDKQRISQQNQKQKILHEVELHKNLRHKHIVGFHSYFEDEKNVYILLEYCSRKSLVHVLKQRKCLTEAEVRFYVKQLVEAVKYLKGQNIVHRDLKLGNMLLDDNMQLKIADFGLATRIMYQGERKMTVCGTPNYIAPEVLQKRGHSFEADVWAIGCIMHALLVGRPPFETSSLKETYVRISANLFTLPPELSQSAKLLIRRCLTKDPSMRPSLDEILKDPFLTDGAVPKCPLAPNGVFVPNSSPLSCTITTVSDKPNSPSDLEKVRRISLQLHQLSMSNKPHSPSHLNRINSKELKKKSTSCGNLVETEDNQDSDVTNLDKTPANICDNKINQDRSSFAQQPLDSFHRPPTAAVLLEVLTTCLDHMPSDVKSNPDSSNVILVSWITKWVDYSNKYGFGYQLSSKAIGVLFNDSTRIFLSPDSKSIQYYDKHSQLSAFSTECVPTDLNKKTTLLHYFTQYMDEHLIQGGNAKTVKQDDETWSGGLFLKKWFRTSKAIFFYLSDGSVQVNFFEDHTKIIVSYHNNDYIVTYIDCDRHVNVYSMVNLIQDGCTSDIANCLSQAKLLLKNLVEIEGEDI